MKINEYHCAIDRVKAKINLQPDKFCDMGVRIFLVILIFSLFKVGVNAQEYPVQKITVPDSVLQIVKKWPGLVGEREKRLKDMAVEINGVYRPMHPSSRFSLTGHRPWFSTGLYAAPCEVITVSKPVSLNGKKVLCRIGASGSVLREKNKPWKRLPQTYVVKELKDGDTTCIFNVNGGNIYIIPEEPFERPETFIISGAVKSPDFVLGKTDPVAWKKEIESTTVPMAEIACNRLIWTITTDILKSLEDPEALMQFYEETLKTDFNAFHGLSDTASLGLNRSPEFPSRCVQDIQIHAGAAYASYPSMFGGDRYARRAVSMERMQNEGESWGFYHEVGHTYQVACWKWGALGEVSNNFHALYAGNRLRNNWGTTRTAKWQGFIDQLKQTELQERDFDTGLNHDSRLVPFCQLAQQYGWRLYAYLSKCARELPDQTASLVTSSNDSRREFFCKRVCEYANADLRPFFDFWGIKYSSFAAADMAALPAYKGDKFWEKWDGALIPDCFTERVVQKKLRDDNYGLTEGEIIRTAWKIIPAESKYYGFASKNEKNTPENILDGNPGTFWASPVLTRPDYDKHPCLVIDMGQEECFDFIEYRSRNFYVEWVNCRKFKVEVREKPRGRWKKLGEFESTEPLGAKSMRFALKKEYKGRYLRLTLLEGFAGKPEESVTSGAACVAEFKIGKQE